MFSLLIVVLCAKSTSVNTVIDGRPLIHYAADFGHKDVIQFLIEKGADLNVSKVSRNCVDPLLLTARSHSVD